MSSVGSQTPPMKILCTCSASKVGGTVLLFYRYWDNSPQLPASHRESADKPADLAAWHRDLTETLNIGGKIRIAKEGYNVTVGGTQDAIHGYMRACCFHWSFAGLQLDTDADQQLFFKPSDGCACVFGAGTKASIRVTAEATPLGVEGFAPADWGCIEALAPAEFHRRVHEQKSLILDVRNHYESRIGYFVDPYSGEAAVRPSIRRFSQWPKYVKQHLQSMNQGDSRQIMTYCTGGIRCEKGVRWMQENAELQQGQKICTLQGGIAAYLTWMDGEIEAGRKVADDSLFRGRNYVFDARGSTGLRTDMMEPVASCHVCGVPSDNLSTCQSRGCHLVLVVCLDCDKGEPRCCEDCRQLESAGDEEGARPICACEQERETRLWGQERIKTPRTQGWRKERRKVGKVSMVMNIPIKIIDQ